jgi:hypothetical protein
LLSHNTSPTLDLGLNLIETAGNMGGVAVEDWRVSSFDLAGVVKDDHLCNK